MRSINLFLLGILFISCSIPVNEIHELSFVADTHNDILLRSMQGEDILNRNPDSQSDLIKLDEGGMDLQVFAIWVSPTEFKEDEYFTRANQMITKLEYLCSRVPDQWAIPYNYQELVYNEQHGIMSCMIGVEGGHSIENDLSKLDHLYERGMHYLGLTWNNSTSWATSAKDETERADSLSFIGLTDFGREVVKRCNELGVMIDVSHSGERTFWDVIEITTKPIIASHSSVYNLCPHFRNLKDDQLRAFRDNGGVVFVNFYPGYVDSTYLKKSELIDAKYELERKELAKELDPNTDSYWYAESKLMKREKQLIAPTIDNVVDHIEYIAELVGVEHVGLGSDWDGVELMPTGLEDVTKLPFITKILLDRGFSVRDVQKILGGNFKRVYKEIIG